MGRFFYQVLFPSSEVCWRRKVLSLFHTFIFQVNLDADLGSGTNTVIVDADSLSSTHGRMGSRHHGTNSIKVDSNFLNKLLSQRFGQAGNY